MTPVSRSRSQVALHFERHESLRSRQPCATLLVGPVGLGSREWQVWFEARGRSTHIVESPALSVLAGPWVERLVASIDLTRAAVVWVGEKARRGPDEVQARLAAMSHFDLDRWFSNLGLGPESDPCAAIVHWSLDQKIEERVTQPERLFPILRDEVLAGRVDFEHTLLKGLSGFVPEDRWPTLLFQQPGEPAPSWVLDAARCCEQATRILPTLPVGVCCDRADAERTLRVANPRRELAWLREGWVDVPGLTREAIRERAAPLTESTLDRLVNDGVSESLAEKLELTANALKEEPKSEETENRARSFAEAFLFERLESIPETAGLFRLNHQFDFKHGHKRAEADIASPHLKLVIELDGGYYHLNADSYRRDRRKDWEYQRRGYWILRFLSEEVIAEMEEMLNRILDAVRERRAGMPSTGRSET